MKDFRNDFLMFKEKLRNGENFAFSRFSDGEMYILQNRQLKLDQSIIQIDDRVQSGPYQKADFKNFNPETDSEFQSKLVTSFQHKQKNYYKGISCSCCVGKENFDWQINLHGGDGDSLTWANIWVNSNYPSFIQEILPILYSKRCVFIGHHDADISLLPFIVKDFRVGYNAFINDYHVIKDMLNWIQNNKVQDFVFLFSASSFTNLAIYELFKQHNNNTYIDIGTCLTPLMNMPTQRDYLQGFWNYKGSNSLNLKCIWN
jgi:hypothetical protein